MLEARSISRGRGDARFFRLFPLHDCQPFHDGKLLFVQCRKPLGQGVQLGQGAFLIQIHRYTGEGVGLEDFPPGRFPLRQLQPLHRVQQGVRGGGEGKLGAAILGG